MCACTYILCAVRDQKYPLVVRTKVVEGKKSVPFRGVSPPLTHTKKINSLGLVKGGGGEKVYPRYIMELSLLLGFRFRSPQDRIMESAIKRFFSAREFYLGRRSNLGFPWSKDFLFSISRFSHITWSTSIWMEEARIPKTDCWIRGPGGLILYFSLSLA